MRKHRYKKTYAVKDFLNERSNKKSKVCVLNAKNLLYILAGLGFFVFSVMTFKMISFKVSPHRVFGAAGLMQANPPKANTSQSAFFKKVFFCASKFTVNYYSPEPPLYDKVNYNEKSSAKINVVEESVHINGVEVKNETDYTVECASILLEKPVLKTEKPKVLIVHTHGSESYTPTKKHQYKHSGNYRTQNTDYNMIKVGERLAQTLKKHGVEVVHDKTINDFPSYNDSYNKTEKIIRKHIEKDKNIVFVLDVHRDAVGTDKDIVKFTSKIEGKNAAQVMIVCGTDTNLENPLWRENFKYAVHMQNYFNINYPGIMRPVNLRKERFNMHLTTGSLLLEIGTNGNTLEEALYSAEIMGEGIADFVKDITGVN